MTTAVVLMAYGSPGSLDDVDAYYRDVTGGRALPPERIEALRERYRAVGGRTPLLEITKAQASALSDALGLPVYVGMKHWHPYIASAVDDALRDGADEIIGIVAAAHESTIGTGGYESRLRGAAGRRVSVRMIRHWHDEPGFAEVFAQRIAAANFDGARLFFTAHSLPARILEAGDPYPAQLRASAVAAAGAREWELVFQSASPAGEPWLGPDIGDALEAFDGRRALVVPIGFTADHLEILYDLDIVASRRAHAAGVRMRRTAMPNADPDLIAVMASAIRRARAEVAA